MRKNVLNSVRAIGGIDRERLQLPLQRGLFLAVLLAMTAAIAFGQTDPWTNVATKLATIFTGPVARGFSLVAIVVGGLGVAFSEGGARRALGGLIFGVGLAIGAVSFLSIFTS